MPLNERSRPGEPPAHALDLPPPYRLVVLREVGDAFAHASAHAAELGAGMLVFVGRFDLAEFAVVLEPEEPLATARLAFYAGMVALTDALAALAPPEKPIAIDWPDAIRVDGGLVGGGRLAWPRQCAESAVPDWLVFAAAIRTVSLGQEQAGLHPLSTALEAEGFADAGSVELVESFARHFMVTLDRCREAGFAPLAGAYAAKLARDGRALASIEESGDLVIGRPGKPLARKRLAEALAEPSWLDPRTGGPRL